MKLFLIFLLAVAPICCFSFDLAAYKNTYQMQVVVPFENALTGAAHNIIEYLAVTPIPKTDSQGKQMAGNLTIQAETLTGNLGSASNPSDGLRVQIDQEAETLAKQWPTLEKQMADTEGQLKSISGRIDETNAQIQEAENRVNFTQKSVREAENALRIEEGRVRDSEKRTSDCLGICRLWTACKKRCPVVNYNESHTAELTLDHARHNLNDTLERLAQFQDILHQFQLQKANLTETKSNLEDTKTQMNAQLSQMYLARAVVNNVDTQLKAIMAHLSTFFGKNHVLIDMIKNLIDTEAVINPMTSIADQIIIFTPNQPDVTYLNSMKAKMATNLPLVQLKLPQYPLAPPSS